MSDELQYLHRKVDDIESNMAQKSDIVLMSSRLDGIDALATELSKNTKAVTDIFIQNAKDEEARKHQMKDIERALISSSKNSVDIQTLKEIAAADKPRKELATWALRCVIGFVVAGILSAAFVASK